MVPLSSGTLLEAILYVSGFAWFQVSGSGGGLGAVHSIAIKPSIGASSCLRKTSGDTRAKTPELRARVSA